MTNELYHHGILGQRKGQRNGPPYPLSRSQHSSTEKRLAKISSSRGAKVAQKAAVKAYKNKVKTLNANKKKADQQKREQEKLASKKAKLLKTRNISKIYKNANLFTDDELKNISNRFKLENDLKDIKNQGFINKGKNFVNTLDIAANATDKASKIATNGVSIYNNVAKVMNSVYGADMKLVGDKAEKPSNKVEQTKNYSTDGKLLGSTVKTTDSRGNVIVINTGNTAGKNNNDDDDKRRK